MMIAKRKAMKLGTTKQQNQKQENTMRALCIVAVLAACAGHAVAQQYVNNGGRILERDLRKGGGGLTPRANMMDEVRLRNALITGNAGGLRSFRGGVGYTAPDEFRGRLSSDNTFSFRRDSASAAAFTAPLRGGDALRYQFLSTTGMATRSRFDDDVTSRLGATGLAAAQARPGQAGNVFSGTTLESASRRSGALRSTAAYAASQDLGPVIVGVVQTEKSQGPVTASSLLGVRSAERASVAGTRLRFPEREKKQERPGLTQSLSESLNTPPEQVAGQNQLEALQEPVVRTLYQDLKQRMREQEKTLPPDETPAPDDVLLPDATKPDANTPDTTKPDPTKPPGSTEDPTERRLRDLRNRLNPESDGLKSNLRGGEGGMKGFSDRDRNIDNMDERSRVERAVERAKAMGMDEKTIDLIRRSGGEASSFIDADIKGPIDPYTDHMTNGQKLLGDGRYFDAEERFSRALAVRPGDVTAMAGRLHSQLGGGLYLSAAMNVRQLFQQAPEVIALRYSGPTIPAPDRLRSIAADIRGNIKRLADTKAPPVIEDGLLLAYVGFQLGERGVVEEGLSQAQAASETNAKPEPLVTLLRKVWLEAPQPTEPSPQNAPQSDPQNTPEQKK
jgi:hypothetical protein